MNDEVIDFGQMKFVIRFSSKQMIAEYLSIQLILLIFVAFKAFFGVHSAVDSFLLSG